MKISQKIWKGFQWVYRNCIKKPVVHVWTRMKAERVQ